MDIMRGRHRESFVNPKPIEPHKPLSYRFSLLANNQVFLPGHRIMVQVQSSWFRSMIETRKPTLLTFSSLTRRLPQGD